jgi:cell division protein ZapA (FtsZ GTPase activity inhibitor)
MKTTKKYTVKILSDSYTLVSDESEKSIMDAASLLINTIEDIRHRAPDIDIKKAIILAGLKIAHQKVLHQDHLDALAYTEQKLIHYIEEEMALETL